MRTVEMEQRVSAKPEDAFAYFTDPAKHVLWQGIRAELEPWPGGAYVIHFSEGARVRGSYLEVDPPRRLVLSWGWESDLDFPPGARDVPPGSTKVHIEFVPDGLDTIIRLRHHDLPEGEFLGVTQTAWALYLGRIAAGLAGKTLEPDPVPGMIQRLEVPERATDA